MGELGLRTARRAKVLTTRILLAGGDYYTHQALNIQQYAKLCFFVLAVCRLRNAHVRKHTRFSPLFRTASDKKLGGAWERDYTTSVGQLKLFRAQILSQGDFLFPCVSGLETAPTCHFSHCKQIRDSNHTHQLTNLQSSLLGDSQPTSKWTSLVCSIHADRNGSNILC